MLRSPTLPHLKCIQSALKPVCFDFTNFFPHCAFSFSFYCCSLSILYILSKLSPLFSPLSDSLSYSLNQCRNLWAPACLAGGEKTAASKHKILSTEKKNTLYGWPFAIFCSLELIKDLIWHHLSTLQHSSNSATATHLEWTRLWTMYMHLFKTLVLLEFCAPNPTLCAPFKSKGYCCWVVLSLCILQITIRICNSIIDDRVCTVERCLIHVWQQKSGDRSTFFSLFVGVQLGSIHH